MTSVAATAAALAEIYAAKPTHRPAPQRAGATKPPQQRAPQMRPPQHREPPQLDQGQPQRPVTPGAHDQNAQEAARAGTRLLPDQSALIASLRMQLLEYKKRDRQQKSILRMETELAYARATIRRLREVASEDASAALRQENEYLNAKVVDLGLALFRAEKELEALRKRGASEPSSEGREDASEDASAALRQENEYLNAKVTDLGLALFRAEKELETLRKRSDDSVPSSPHKG